MPTEPDALDRVIAESLECSDPRAAQLLPALLGEGVRAVVFYGSRFAGGGARGSELDFFVVVDSLRRYHAGLLDWLLGEVLPPSTYHLRAPAGVAKVCVVSVAQLQRETSAAAGDLHHLGRFSKRFGLLHSDGEEATAMVRGARRAALLALLPHVLALLPPAFTLDEMMLALLGISYRGEPRVVEPGKVARIFAADRAHYLEVGRLLLAGCPAVTAVEGGDGQARYRQALPTARARAAALRLIARSRRRALLRWPKHLVTFDGWLDYVLAKVERNTDSAPPISERTRRHPLLFGWSYLRSLRHQRLLR